MDIQLYSRQLYTFGKEAMEKITKSIVTIIGLDGLGTEVAKCLVLGGIHKLYICDESVITMKDLASCYYYSKEDILKIKSAVILNKLKELNPYVEIQRINNIATHAVDSEIFVFCNHNFYDLLTVSNIIHSNNKKIITCSTEGLFGQIFCDFNTGFLVTDLDGEELKTGKIINLTRELDSVMLESANEHNLCRYDTIKIKYKLHEFTTKINKIINSKKFTVTCNDFYDLIENHSDIYFEQIKDNIIINFKSLIESLEDFDKVNSFDAFNPDYAKLCHRMFLYKNYNKKYTFTEQEQIKLEKYLKTGLGNFCPMQSIIGAITAQETMKAITGKYTPIQQWLYFDELDLIDLEDLKDLEHIDTTSRYIGQEIIFGPTLQKKLNDSKIFIVGSGAIGCEHLKNFGMMGVGDITITDMDTIEKSNLNRQFLFRNTDINNYKSMTASREIIKMNPEIKVTAYKLKVGPETEAIFNDKFFKELTCIANALDNISARIFVDSLCVKYQKPLLESGTLGTKGNIQTIIPHLTETYGSQTDPVEKTIPFCTLKNFPYQIEHTIQYARDYFEGIFVNLPNKVNQYMDKKLEFLNSFTLIELDDFYHEYSNLITNMPKEFKDCINYAHTLWYKLFNFQIRDLIKKFPEDELDDITLGNKFWSGTKSFPQYRNIDLENNEDYNFIKSFAILFANMFNIAIPETIIIEPFTIIPSYNTQTINIGKSEDEQKKLNEERLLSLNREKIIEEFVKLPILTNKMIVNEFEKDNDDNHHINFIHSFSNLRAENYKIKTIEKLETKRIAGKIIPAIATTTSLVSGLVAIEFIKILKNKTDISNYKNYFLNLALSLFTYSEPGSVTVNYIGDKFKFTVWDSFNFKDIYLKELLEFFQINYKIEITMVVCGQKMLYSPFMDKTKAKERKNTKISDIYTQLFETLNTNIIELNISGELIESPDEELELPICKICL